MADVEMQSDSDESPMEDYDEEIEKIKKKLLQDDRNISAANTLLHLLKKNGDFEELDDKRKEFVEWAPLTAKNWVDWITDTIAKGQTPIEEIDKMFEKALFDENDVAIWVERIFFAQKIDPESCRKICELALAAIGGRYDSGGHVWIIFLEYEREKLKSE
uniref:Suppressor of forked domain-containing protein n=1 Tax=Caenorhabditis japonica TaxID=281687 RepID=A0A8R1I5Q5_CAEJA